MRKFERILESLLKGENTKTYFSTDRVTTRHEAWFLGQFLSNMVLIEKIDLLRKDIKKLQDKKSVRRKKKE